MNRWDLDAEGVGRVTGWDAPKATRGRWRWAPATATGLVLASAACSLLLDHDPLQCQSNVDCTRFGNDLICRNGLCAASLDAGLGASAGRDQYYALDQSSVDDSAAQSVDSSSLSDGPPRAVAPSFSDGASDVSANGPIDASVAPGTVPPPLSPADAGPLSDATSGSDGSIPPMQLDARPDSARPSDPTLAGYWSFDEGTGTIAADGSGHGHDGLLQPGATWGPGKVGSHCLVLSTAGGFVDIASAVVNTSLPYSVSAWAEFDPLGGDQTPVSIDGTSRSAFFFQQRADGYFQFLAPDSDSSAASESSVLAAALTPARTWYYFTGVFDGSSLYLYTNGALESSVSFTRPWAALGHTFIGRAKYNGKYFAYLTGAIDEVRIYSRALKASEVQSLYLLH